MELVVGASEASMKSLLSKLGGLLAHEYSLIRGVRGDIQYINDEMASMQAFLGDLSITTPQDHDRRMKDWMKQIRDVTYDVEDCVDAFAHRLPHDPGGDVCCAFVRARVYEIWTWWPRREISLRIAELKMRAQQIGERRSRYGVENPTSAGKKSVGGATRFDAAENQQTSLKLVGTKTPVGVDKDMEKLGKWVRIFVEETTETNPPCCAVHCRVRRGGHWARLPSPRHCTRNTVINLNAEQWSRCPRASTSRQYNGAFSVKSCIDQKMVTSSKPAVVAAPRRRNA